MDVQLHSALEDRLLATAFLNLDFNPALRAIGESSTTANDVSEILIQYCVLPSVIVELLDRGVKKLDEWVPVRDELLRNLGEELGTRTGAKTHFSILKGGLVEELGLNLAPVLSPSIATITFIEVVRSAISNGSLHFAAGALYALEASAVPELRIVARLINSYSLAERGKAVISEEFDNGDKEGPWSLDRFFAAHIRDFELGHENRLASAVSPYLAGAADREGFIDGFECVISSMETWWVSIVQEIKLGR